MSPRFGYEGEKPRFCASHKEKQMINLKDRRCEHHGCTTQVRETLTLDFILVVLALLSCSKALVQLPHVTSQSQELRHVE